MAKFTILEPMSAGDVIDRSVRLYRRNFTPLLSIVAIPSLVGYMASTMIWFGYSRLIIGSVENGGQAAPTATSILMLIVGIILYPVWLFVLFFTISGLVRVVGDHVMLGEAITFRKCFAAARSRLGDIVLMCLLSIAILIGLYTVFSFIFFIVAIVVAFLLGATVSSGMPPWFAGLISAILAIVVIGIGIAIALTIISRIIFIPQIVMIEGQSAGAAFSRAMQLGKGNWYKLGAIVLFTYFVSLSLLTALTLPVLTVLYFMDVLSMEMVFGSSWNIVYTSFSQLSSLLCLPIWFICFTLLYFDSRVRKEAYDIELLAREVNPEFYWQPQVAGMGYPLAGMPYYGRNYVQTSPLGLAGWRPNQQSPAAMQPPSGLGSIPSTPANGTPPAAPQQSGWTAPQPPQQRFSPPVNGNSATNQPPDGMSNTDGNSSAQRTAPMGENQQYEFGDRQVNNSSASCKVCGTALESGARFCMRCGTAVESV